MVCDQVRRILQTRVGEHRAHTAYTALEEQCHFTLHDTLKTRANKCIPVVTHIVSKMPWTLMILSVIRV